VGMPEGWGGKEVGGKRRMWGREEGLTTESVLGRNTASQIDRRLWGVTLRKGPEGGHRKIRVWFNEKSY